MACSVTDSSVRGATCGRKADVGRMPVCTRSRVPTGFPRNPIRTSTSVNSCSRAPQADRVRSASWAAKFNSCGTRRKGIGPTSATGSSSVCSSSRTAEKDGSSLSHHPGHGTHGERQNTGPGGGRTSPRPGRSRGGLPPTGTRGYAMPLNRRGDHGGLPSSLAFPGKSFTCQRPARGERPGCVGPAASRRGHGAGTAGRDPAGAAP